MGVLKKKPLSFLIAAGLVSLLTALAAFPGSSVVTAPSSSYVYPIIAPRKSGDFGKRRHPILRIDRHHSGMDLAAPMDAPIRSIQAGTVIFADPYEGYGRLVVVRHKNGMTSHYGHCNVIKAKPGQKVKAGEIIATVGESGMTTGPHLHFEVRVNGIAQNPDNYIPGLALGAEG